MDGISFPKKYLVNQGQLLYLRNCDGEMLAAISFYLIAFFTVLGSGLVVFSWNPVHSVLWLIFVFLNVAVLFVILGAEFLGMILVIVYVGAVAVLFMFVVMMLNIGISTVRAGLLRYLPIGGFIGLILLVEVLFVVITFSKNESLQNFKVMNGINNSVSNTEALGNVLYTQYFYLFQVSGLVLLVAMIGAIILTLRQRTGVHRQDPNLQTARTKEESIEIKKIVPRSGIE